MANMLGVAMQCLFKALLGGRLARSTLLNRCSIRPGCLQSESQRHLRTAVCMAVQTKESPKPWHGSMRPRHETFHDATEGIEAYKTSPFAARTKCVATT